MVQLLLLGPSRSIMEFSWHLCIRQEKTLARVQVQQTPLAILIEMCTDSTQVSFKEQRYSTNCHHSSATRKSFNIKSATTTCNKNNNITTISTKPNTCRSQASTSKILWEKTALIISSTPISRNLTTWTLKKMSISCIMLP